MTRIPVKRDFWYEDIKGNKIILKSCDSFHVKYIIIIDSTMFLNITLYFELPQQWPVDLLMYSNLYDN